MRWLQPETILKGIYLGFLVYAAALQPDWRAVAVVPLCALGGLVLALAVAAATRVRQGFLVQGRLSGFLLFLLLESPTLIYLGVLTGTVVGIYVMPRNPELVDPDWWLGRAVLGGAVLGVIFGLLTEVKDRWTRLGVGLLLALGLIGGAVYLFGYDGRILGVTFSLAPLVPVADARLFGVQLLLGIPLFYLLDFAGQQDESEGDVASLCALLSLGMLKLFQGTHNPTYEWIPIALPLGLYAYYTWGTLPRLRVFKHSLRGFSYAKIGKHRHALLAFRRALQLDPQNTRAREGFWGVHGRLDVPQLARDPETLALVDFDLCIERVGSLLMQPGPSAAKLQEAHKLLDMVLAQRSALRPKVNYWRAVADTHAQKYEEAAAELGQLLDPGKSAPDDSQRRAVLLQGWQLALTLHPELRRRVGDPQLALPGRRMEAIGAVERQLGAYPDDTDAWNLKRILYQDVSEADYDATAGPNGPAPAFDYPHAQQLGLALIGDPARWRRGAEYLRLAARGLPSMGPSIFVQIAQAHDRAGDPDGAWRHYELAKQVGRAAGPQNLTEEDRQLYYATVKMLGDAAQERSEVESAIENFRIYSEYNRSGVETLRTLAALYEQKGDPLSALHFTELGLVYNARDKDLLERRDRYYFSVMPDDLRARLQTYGGGADADYCLRKARSLLDYRDADLDVIDWADHLIELARVLKPDTIQVKVLRARARLRRGERDEAVATLEEVRTNKPEKFATSEDEEAWYMSCQLLGRIYLEELGRPDLAVPCLIDFRKCARSGADTLYRLGQAYEQLGDRARALKCYEHVTSYDNHPLLYEAREAIHRVKAS
jgi:tetratricopeptide (TPR) repeat protein